MNNKKNITTNIILIVMACIVIITGIMVGITLHDLKDSIDNKGNPINSNEPENNNLSELKEVKDCFHKLDEIPLFIQVQNGVDTSITYVYNNKHECLSQFIYEDDGTELMDTTIYLNDNKAVDYGEYLSYSTQLSIMDMLELALTAADKGIAVVTPGEVSDDGLAKEVYIDIRSYANIGKMYDLVDQNFSYEELEGIRTLASEIKESYNELDIDHPNLRFSFIIDTEHDVLAGANLWLYFGTEDPDKVKVGASDKSSLSFWIMNGYHVISDWDMLDDWYTMDWSTLEDWEDLEPAEKLLTEQYGIISEVLSKHFISTDDSDDSDNTVESDDSVESDNPVESDSIEDINN